jgi:hypothetical protein
VYVCVARLIADELIFAVAGKKSMSFTSSKSFVMENCKPFVIGSLFGAVIASWALWAIQTSKQGRVLRRAHREQSHLQALDFMSADEIRTATSWPFTSWPLALEEDGLAGGGGGGGGGSGN